MEKRDLIVIIIAVFIVLIMAMYIKPLVTGKPVQLIPDELAEFMKGNNQSSAQNGTGPVPVTPVPKRVKPSLVSINPDTLTSYNTSSTVVIEGMNLTDSMNITFFKDGINQTFPTSTENGTLVAQNVSLPEGNWTIKIVDSSGKGITYNTTRTVQVYAQVTPVPTWDGNPLPLKVTEKPVLSVFQTRPYPKDTIVNETPMKTYSNFGGVRGVTTAPISVPYGYWDLVYTVDFQTNIANPKDTADNVFEFNKQYKEPLVTYEGDPVIFYPKNSLIPEQIPVKEEVESEDIFRPSRDTVLSKIPNDEPDADKPFETKITDYSGQALVETVGYTKPDIAITIKNLDSPDTPAIIIRPEGGIDPLQWDETKHKEEAEKILKQKGMQELFDSAVYQKEWDDSWENAKDPRPWSQRIFGPGNYTFDINTQSIDSYNIQIKVPDFVNRTHMNVTSGTYGIQVQDIRDILNGFIRDYNKKVDIHYYPSLSGYLSTDLKSSDARNSTYRKLSQARASGNRIDDIMIDDILIQGDAATVRGEFSVDNNGYKKQVPLDMSLVHEDTGWKIQNIPEIR